MNCPVCGYPAVRVSNNYWCQNDRIYVGNALVPETPNEPIPEPIYAEPAKSRKNTKVFNSLVWVVMGILYVVVIVLVVWSVFSGGFDSSSVFE